MILLPLAAPSADVRDGAARVRPTSTALVLVSEFGPFHDFARRAHTMYLNGFSESAVLACRESALVSASAGDSVSTRFLLYVEGIALQELGRHHEAVTVALDLLGGLDDEPDLMWRAKALALLAESSTQVGEVNRAMDALAEGTWLVANTKPGRYSHLSASTAIAVALRAVYLFEQADELLGAIQLGDDLDVDLQVVQERALLSAYWGATLMVVGHGEAARQQLVRTGERALWMGRLARLAGNTEMEARAEVVEAYGLSCLGYVQLAAAKVSAAVPRFRLRDELIETHLAHLVLGWAATESGDFGEARHHLFAALTNADKANRDIWAAAAMEALADLEVAEHGPHPAVNMWKRLAREALARVWAERDGRFTALLSRNQVRSLTAETDRMGLAAMRDHLTGLGNRQMMTTTLERVGADFSAVFIDVDEFKLINDTYSHAVGDEVLRRIAVILSAHCRSDDVAVRYGGDEFVILVLAGGGAAEEVARRLHKEVRDAPWAQVAAGLKVTVSVGVGRPVPGQGSVAAADAALYAAKRAGRDRVVTV